MAKIIELQLKINDKDFVASITNSDSLINDLKKRVNSVPDGLAKWGNIVTGFNQGLDAAQKVFSVISKPLDAAGQFEQYETSLRVMLGSADAAKQRLKELTDFAAATPFTLPQVVEAANQLQAIGKYSQDTLRDLGDLASASGKPMEQALSAYAKMMTGQKGIAIDMFRDLLISTDDWAKATGAKMGKNGELQASVDQMAEALPKILKEKGFSGMMDEQSKTLKGMESNFDDALYKIEATFGKILLPTAKSVITTLNNGLDMLIPNTKRAVEAFEAQSQKVKDLENNINPLLTRYDQLKSKAHLNTQEQTDLKDIIQKLARAVPDAVTQWNDYGEALDINRGKVKDFVEAEKARLKWMNRDAIKEQEDYLNATKGNIDKYSKMLQEGATYKTRELPGGGTETYLYEFLPADKQGFLDKIAQYKNDLTGIEQQIKKLKGEDFTLPEPVGNKGGKTGLDDFAKERDKYLADSAKKNAIANATEIEQARLKNLTLEQLEKEKNDKLKEQADIASQIKKSTNKTEFDQLVIKKEIADKSVDLTKDEIKKRGEDYKKFLADKEKQFASEKFLEDGKYKTLKQLLIDYTAQKTEQKNIEIEMIAATDKKEYDSLQNQKAIVEQKLSLTQQLIDAKKQQDEDYYSTVKYLDDDYLTYKLQQIEAQKKAMLDAGISGVDAKLFETESIKQIEQDYYDWKWEKYLKDNQIFAAGLNLMWAGYDTFFRTITNAEMTGKERLSAVWESIKNSFVDMLGQMLKDYLMHMIAKAVIGDASMAAAIASAAVTGTSIAAAYAPAAAFASIASFGAADVAGSLGMSSTVGLAYMLSVPKFGNGGWVAGPGHDQGGVLINAEGNEYMYSRDLARENISLLDRLNNQGDLSMSYAGFELIAKKIDEQTNRLEAVERLVTMDPYRFNEEYNNFLNKQEKIT